MFIRAKLRLTPHRPSLPIIFLASIQSLVNKLDEIRLSDSNALIFTETWLHSSIPDTATELSRNSMHRADRTSDDSSKSRGGGLSSQQDLDYRLLLLGDTLQLTLSLSWLNVDCIIWLGNLHPS